MLDFNNTKVNDCELVIRTAHGIRYIGVYPNDMVMISKVPLDTYKSDLSDSETDAVMELLENFDLSDGQPYYKDYHDKQIVAIIDAILAAN